MTMMTVGRRRATPWKIGVGVLLLLAAAGNSTRPVTGGTAGALGSLTGLCILVFGGIALIVSGLPKNLGNQGFVKQRRRLWLKYMGVGFVLMALVAGGLAFSGFVVAGVLVTWLYWFVWTWVSWKVADRKTTEKLQVRV